MMETTKLDLKTPAGISEYLAHTTFSSKQIDAVSGGNTNYVYRLHLENAYQGHATLILKHATDFAASSQFEITARRQVYEVAALKAVKALLPSDSLVNVPAVHLFDEASHIIIMEDCGPSTRTLKEILISNPPSLQDANLIGLALGVFLAKLHQPNLFPRETIKLVSQYKLSRRVYGFVTYGQIPETLKGEANIASLSDPMLNVQSDQLGKIGDICAQKIKLIDEIQNGIITHGDFWTGNVLVSYTNEGKLKKISVVDWEIVREGLPGLDIGQFCAETRLVGRFYPERMTVTNTLVTAFLMAYQPAEIEICASALIHYGAHLVAWCPRVPWGDRDTTRAMVKEGMEMMLLGNSSSKEQLQSTFLSPLIDI